VITGRAAGSRCHQDAELVHPDERASEMTSGRGAGNNRDNELDRLQRHYPRWRIWRGHTTGGYWALPPRDHPAVRGLLSASNLDELGRRLAQAEERHDR
jgi:hypothetical protein